MTNKTGQLRLPFSHISGEFRSPAALSPTRFRRRWWTLALVAVLAVLATGCEPDWTTVPPSVRGADGPRQVAEYGYAPTNTNNDASVRIECHWKEAGKFDPIVFPGQSNVGHAHEFFGGDVDPNTTDPTGANSTCNGGTLNSTAYWVPMMVRSDTWDGSGFDRVPFAVGSYLMPLQVYYKSAYDGVLANDVDQWFPRGLKIIAGTSSATSPQPISVVQWGCISSGDVTSVVNGIWERTSIPKDCPPGRIIQARIQFPQCWDGRNLDSPDHKSHMSYAVGWPDQGCPTSHPVALPKIEEFFRWRVGPEGATNYRLVTDVYNSSEAGYSLHADWLNGWDPAVGQAAYDNCYVPQARDCRMNLYAPVGDGGWWRLDEVSGPDLQPVP
jgi:hypothetical protein